MKTADLLLLVAIVLACSSVQAEEAQNTPFFRKVMLESSGQAVFNEEDFSISDLKLDANGYELYKFEVSVSEFGKVLSVKQVSGTDNPIHSQKLIANIQQYQYRPQIVNFKPVPSQITEEIWFAMPNVSGPFLPSYNCTDEVNPDTLKKAEVIYPVSLLYKGTTGKTVIVFSVSKEGKATNIEPLQYDNELFARHAMISLRDWQFKPAEFNGKYVSCRIAIEFEYTF
jgi:hypothetical protein